MEFNKILVARHSPKNKCFSAEGEFLIIAPKDYMWRGQIPSDYHFFLGITTHKPSLYGWVKLLDFKIKALKLAEMYTPNPSDELIKSCDLLLRAVQDQKEDTPMACTFSEIDLLSKKKKIMSVHRVIFYNK